MSSKPELGYWAIRGLAQPCRLLLAYTGTEFLDTKYKVTGEAPKRDMSAWFGVKFTKGLDFPNLPYYIDGEVKLTQTNAILRHIARKHDLCGNTVEERARVDMAAEVVMDMRNAAVGLFYGPDYEASLAPYLEKLQTTLGALSTFLGARTWLAGPCLSFPDFHFYEMLEQHLLLQPDCLQAFPTLVSFHARFEALPQIASYMQSPDFMSAPCNNVMAKWGNK